MSVTIVTLMFKLPLMINEISPWKRNRPTSYGCVTGVNRGDPTRALYDHGADIVVADLGELRVVTADEATSSARQLPSALDCLDEIIPDAARMPVVFLDYDGTLTPIVAHPDDATLNDRMRATLRRLDGLCEVAIISGRDLGDVRDSGGINDIWYAGSHGFDIAGPEGERGQYEEGRGHLPALDAAEQTLRETLATIPGCLVERKRFSIAIHYRQVTQDKVDTVKQAVDQVHSAHAGLSLTTGKKIFELQPDIDWDKGKALRWLIQKLELNMTRFVAVYIGDNVTDEDAFRELQGDGVGIQVAQKDQPTRASYRLENPNAVQRFLDRLADKLQESAP